MDAEAVSAALAPQVLAPPIAKELGLPGKAVEIALSLLAAGAQPAFLAAYRPERIAPLGIRDLERVQAAAARAAAFEFRRQEQLEELRRRGLQDGPIGRHVARARHPVDLEDVKIALRKRKKTAAAKARGQGLGSLADAIWSAGSSGLLSSPSTAKSSGRRKKGGSASERAEPAEAEAEARGEAEAEGTAAATDPSGTGVEASARDDTGRQSETGAHGELDAQAEAGGRAETDAQAEAGARAETETGAAVERDAQSEAGAPVETDGTRGGGGAQAHTDDAQAAAAVADDSDARAKTGQDQAAAAVGPTAEGDETGGPSPQDDVGAEADTAAQSGMPATPDASEHADAPAVARAELAVPPEVEALAADATSEAFPTAADAVVGAKAICVEQIAELAPLRAKLRKLLLDHGKLHTHVVEAKKDKASRYTKFFDRAEPCKGMAPSNVLAMTRAEREGLLSVDIDVDEQRVQQTIRSVLGIDVEHPCGRVLDQAAREAWAGPLGKAIHSGVRRLVKERADRQAIEEFCGGLRPLLMAPAFGPVPVIGIDPGHQNGCRVVVVSADGTPLADDTVFPLQPKLQAPQAKARIAELCTEHGVKGIAVGNGNGGRDVERLCREMVRDTEGLRGVAVVSVDDSAAALVAASRQAKQEVAKGDVALRRALSLARRLQDPLAELSKLDLRKLGLGQYQHEVDQEELRSSLEQVLASCTSDVSLDPNTASVDRLARIPGLSQALAKAIVAHREQHGPLRSRQVLMDVPGIAGKAFEQSAGFLRIAGSEHPLDVTSIHPERYGQVTQMARDLGVTVADLIGDAELVGKIEVERYLDTPGVSGEPLGRATADMVLGELRNPGKDPRPPFTTVEFDPRLTSFSDLEVGQELEGIITHLAAFGAFVDVGLPQEGLVHVSELSHDFIKSPLDAVHVGQKVKGRVIEISPERKRFSLSLKALRPRPERPRRDETKRSGKGRGKGKGERGEKGKGRGKGKPRHKDRGKQPRSDRTLGFRLDLSEIAKQLDES